MSVDLRSDTVTHPTRPTLRARSADITASIRPGIAAGSSL